MILPELILSTSILSLAFFVWAVLAKYKNQGDLENSSFSEGEGDSGREKLCDENLNEDCNLESCSSSVYADSFKDETPLSSTPGTPKTASGLSRRQRKNRKKDEHGKVKKSTSPILSRTSSEEVKPEMTRSKKNSVPCKQYTKLNRPDETIYEMLSSYSLTLDQLRQLGFPMDSSLYPGKAYIYRDPEFSSLLPEGEITEFDDDEDAPHSLDATAQPFFPQSANKNKYSNDCSGPVLNATAKEFVPSDLKGMGGKKTLTGVQSSPNLDATESSAPNSLTSVHSSPNLMDQSVSLLSSSTTVISRVIDPTSISSNKTGDEFELSERRCVRCSKSFYMLPGGDYYSQESCVYHWGKLRSDEPSKKNNPLYQCCGLTVRSSRKGCSSASLHVWSGLPLTRGIFGPLDGYSKTKFRKTLPKEGNYGVFGVDCEMCYTNVGLEVTKVTVVGMDGRLVYESLVNPENDIIDYNTRFSGITAKDLNRGQTKTLKEVQNDLNGFINADSILIGHGLENDLRALNLVHLSVIDTSLVFPHFYGLPYRRSLRSLVRSYLKRDIQGNAWGHDSYEDARACVELMLWKARKDVEKVEKMEKMPARKI